MSPQLIITIFGILIATLLLLLLMQRKSNRLISMSKKHLLNKIHSSDIEQNNKEQFEQQLLTLIKSKQKFPSLLYISLSVFIVISSLMLYKFISQPPQEIQQAPEMSMEQAINELERKLQEQPNDLEGNILLARSYMAIKNYNKAVTAYKKANEIEANNPNILTELAESIALNNNNKSFLGEPEMFLKKAVEINPNHEKALWLYGMTFYERGDLAQTEQLWTHLYNIIKNEGAKKQLKIQLDDVRSKIGLVDSGVSTNSSSISIEITLDPALKNVITDQSVLFISAKEPNGIPMPIAAKRILINQHQLNDIIQVELTDLDSLQKQRTLSSFEEVSIQAKLSLSGTADSEDSDLKSQAKTVKLADSNIITLEIKPE